MNATVIAALAFLGISAATLLGLRLRAALPDRYLSADTKDTVRLGTGLVATMTALLLGLLIASAQDSYDTQRGQVIQLAAEVDFLDRVLATYGPETTESRSLLLKSTEGVVQKLWPEASQAGKEDPALAAGQALFNAIHKLKPQNDEQHALKEQALNTVTNLSQTRWLLFAQVDASIPRPLLTIPVVWLAIIFLSFGLFAPTNKTVLITMAIVTLSVSSALFLILELDRPFDGLLQVSSAPVRSAISRLGR